MYVPRHFRWKDPNQVIEFIGQYPFGELITGQGKILVTHLPFVSKVVDGQLILRTHMSRENPQWQDMDHAEVLVVFQHPHAYVSPSWYSENLNVPTWNYLAAHCYGTAKLIHAEDEAECIMLEMFDAFDPDYLKQYHSLPRAYIKKLYSGIMAFEIKVHDLQAKAKVSQNKPASDQENIIKMLASETDHSAKDLSHWMKKVLEVQ